MNRAAGPLFCRGFTCRIGFINSVTIFTCGQLPVFALSTNPFTIFGNSLTSVFRIYALQPAGANNRLSSLVSATPPVTPPAFTTSTFATRFFTSHPHKAKRETP